MKWLWTFLWNASEWSGVGLGKYAPYVFAKMIGSEGNEVDSLGREIGGK